MCAALLSSGIGKKDGTEKLVGADAQLSKIG
jgi:hypothetical protein